MEHGNIKILMVEDNENVLHLNRTVLERQGYSVLCAGSLREARILLERHRAEISLAVLDILLPDGNGLDFASELKAAASCPVLMLTSKRSYNDIVAGLSGAADDYLTKPYRIEELTAHIKVLLQKRQASTAERLVCGPLSIDMPSGRAFLFDEDLLLSPREVAVLLVLMQSEGCFISLQRLYERAWRLPFQADSGAIKTTVSRLRKKISTSGYTIEAERGQGYRLLKEV